MQVDYGFPMINHSFSAFLISFSDTMVLSFVGLLTLIFGRGCSSVIRALVNQSEGHGFE